MRSLQHGAAAVRVATSYRPGPDVHLVRQAVLSASPWGRARLVGSREQRAMLGESRAENLAELVLDRLEPTVDRGGLGVGDRGL